ncbi:MAG: peptidyl-prolyl cis-trans isomerase [Gemmata sp.]
MDAANPLGRCLLMAVGLAAVIGCQTDRASGIAPLSSAARGQMPLAPAAPLAPLPPPTAPGTGGALTPVGPAKPAPVTPAPVPPTIGGAAVPGAPIPPELKGLKGDPIQKTGFTASKALPTAADALKASVPRVKVVAIVGANNVITDQEVVEGVYQQYHQIAALSGYARTAKHKEMYAVVLRKTIERELILDEMYSKLKKANKMNVIEEIKDFAGQAADRQLRAFRNDSGAKSDEEFAAMLRSQGLSVQVIRRQLERQMMAEQYVSSALKEKNRRAGLAEVREYYDKRPDEFKVPDRVKWQHIFIALKNYPAPRAAYDRAAALWQQAAAGADFGALAVQYDEGFAKQQKGFGTGEKRNEIQPADLEETLWALKPGQIGAVVETPTGYHVVKVIERDYAGVQPFDTAVQSKVRDKITRAATEAEYKKLVDELWRKGVVRVFEE